MNVRRQPLGCRKENSLTKQSLLFSRTLTCTTFDTYVIAIIDGLIDTKTDYPQSELNCFFYRLQLFLCILYLVYFSLNFINISTCRPLKLLSYLFQQKMILSSDRHQVLQIYQCVPDHEGCSNYGINDAPTSYYGICSLENRFYRLAEIKNYSLSDDVFT